MCTLHAKKTCFSVLNALCGATAVNQKAWRGASGGFPYNKTVGVKSGRKKKQI